MLSAIGRQREKQLKRFKRFFRAQRGQDMVEYGLLAAFISTVAIAALLYFRPWLEPVYLKVQDAVRRAATARPGEPGTGTHPGGDTPSE